MIDLDVIEVGNNVLLCNGNRGYIVVIGEQVAQFTDIVAYCSWGILFGRKIISEFYK
jgi:hypothetical protein